VTVDSQAPNANALGGNRHGGKFCKFQVTSYLTKCDGPSETNLLIILVYRTQRPDMNFMSLQSAAVPNRSSSRYRSLWLGISMSGFPSDPKFPLSIGVDACKFAL